MGDNVGSRALCAYAAAMSLTVPIWILASATAILAIGVITIALAIRSALSQLVAQRELASQLADLAALHARDLRQSVDDRRRAQACRVFIELDRGDPSGTDLTPWQVTATVHNTSDQPVYDLYVIWQHGNVRLGRPDRSTRLLPGLDVCFSRGPDTSGDRSSTTTGSPAPDGSTSVLTLATTATTVDPAAVTAFLTFRDTAGIRWTVREDGTLSDISPASPDIPAAQD